MIKLRSQMVFALGANAVILGIAFVTSIVLTRVLLPEGRGIIAAAILWPVLLTAFGSLGLIDAIVYFVAKNQTSIGTIFFNVIVLGLIQAIVLIPLGQIVMPLVLSSQTPITVEISRSYLVLIPVSLITQYGVAILQGLMRSIKFNLMRLIIPTGYFLLVVITSLLRVCTPAIVVWGLLILNFIGLIAVLLLLRQTKAYIGWRINMSLSMEMLKYGTKSMIGTVFSTANLQFDQVLLAAWTSSRLLGLYVIAVNSANLILILPTALQFILSPAIAREPDETKRFHLLEHVLPLYWFASVTVTVTLGVLFPFLIPLLYGPEAVGSVVSAEFLLVGALMLCGRIALSSVALGFGEPLLSSRAEGVATVVTFVLLMLLVKPFGIIGASVTSVIAYGVSLLVLSRSMYRRFGLRPRRLFNPSVGFSLLQVEARRFVHAMQTRIEQRRAS